MQTESTIKEITIERVATLSLLRVVDFAAIEKNAVDGKITVEDLQTAGDFVVQIQPNGRGAEPVRVPVASAEAGTSYMDGFSSAVGLKKKAPRKVKAATKKAPAKK